MALAGVLTVLFACLDLKSTLGGEHHYLLYILAAAMKPRMLLTLGEDGRPLSVPVRVGTAVDTVAQAGRPKTITGAEGSWEEGVATAELLAERGFASVVHSSGVVEWQGSERGVRNGGSRQGHAAGARCFVKGGNNAHSTRPLDPCLRPFARAGFQTHNTPVLLGVGERAELGTEEWLPLSPILEGQVILVKNPDYTAMDESK